MRIRVRHSSIPIIAVSVLEGFILNIYKSLRHNDTQHPVEMCCSLIAQETFSVVFQLNGNIVKLFLLNFLGRNKNNHNIE